MTPVHPVTLELERPQRFDRAQVILRFVLLVLLSMLGTSFVYWVLYLGLPAYAAIRLTQAGQARYLAEDGPRIGRGLDWLARLFAYLALLTDKLPTDGQPGARLQLEPAGAPTVGSALMRLLTSIPAVLLFAVLSFVAGILWLVAALWVLVSERYPGLIYDYQAAVLRFQLRLFAYHLSVVDRYPSLEESTPRTEIAPTA